MMFQVLRATKPRADQSDLSLHQVRQINGCLMRVPQNFYTWVWLVLPPFVLV